MASTKSAGAQSESAERGKMQDIGTRRCKRAFDGSCWLRCLLALKHRKHIKKHRKRGSFRFERTKSAAQAQALVRKSISII